MDKDWNRFTDWALDKAKKIGQEIDLYDFMGMLGTSRVLFLMYHYHNISPYTFRYNLGFRDTWFTGRGKNDLAQVFRISEYHFTVPKIFPTIPFVFLLKEDEFEITLIYHETLTTSNLPVGWSYQGPYSSQKFAYTKKEIESLTLPGR